ncbi:MAG TPA: hypothetical protein VLA97_08860 [Nocardioidaceae bacterium]|nr:hypothetical protein [Nocardioidaceae bacterium]
MEELAGFDLEDTVLLEEIALVADLMVAASLSPGPLEQGTIDAILNREARARR